MRLLLKIPTIPVAVDNSVDTNARRIPIETLLNESFRHESFPPSKVTFFITLQRFGDNPEQCNTSNIVAPRLSQ
jgi:hypothetical protein